MFIEVSKSEFLRDTKTDTGLRMEAYLDEGEYQKGIKVPDKDLKNLNMTKNDELSNWKYTRSNNVNHQQRRLLVRP